MTLDSRFLLITTAHAQKFGTPNAVFCKGALKTALILIIALWSGTSHSACPLSSADLEPHAHLMRNLRIGNMRFPQSELGIRLQMLSSFILDPTDAKHLFSDPNIDRHRNLMNNAHLKHGIKVFSADFEKPLPDSELIDPKRPLEVARSFLRLLAHDLMLLIAGLSPKNRLAPAIATGLFNSCHLDPFGERPYTNPAAIEQINLFFKKSHEGAVSIARAIEHVLQSPEAIQLSKQRLAAIDSVAPTLALSPGQTNAAKDQLESRIRQLDEQMLDTLKNRLSQDLQWPVYRSIEAVFDSIGV